MNEIKQINNAIEQLKKEVWYIAKVSIPDILKALGGLVAPNLDGIKADIKSNSDRISSLENSVTGQTSTLGVINEKLNQHEGQFTTIEASISEHGTTLNAISTTVDTHEEKIKNCQNLANANNTAVNACLKSVNAMDDRVIACEFDINNCKKELSEIKPTLQQQTEQLQAHEGKISDCEDNLQTLSSNIGTITNALNDTIGLVGDLSSSLQAVLTTASSNKTAINEHTSQISSLSKRVSTLENGFNEHKQIFNTWKTSVDNAISNLQNSGGQGGSAVQLDLIYDNTSTDAAINRGFTNGMVGGNSFDFDFTSYKKVHVYAGLNKNDAYTVIHLDKRRYAEGNLMAVSVGSNRIINMKVNITPAKNRFVVNQLGWFEANLTTGAISFTRDKGNTSHFVYRIEGEK